MQGKPIYAVGLDAGSNYTRFAIGVLEHTGLRVIGIGQAESQGWVKGRIADQRAVSDSILRAVREGGGELYIWTVDDAKRIERLTAMGVDGIITNDPRLF